MQTVFHAAGSRGVANHGWLKSFHTFSFANYFNPDRVRFGLLRVLNDDTIAGGTGFGTHPHDNMEIVSIPLSGALEHRDSMGNSSVIRSGEVQIMSAGTGITHSEYNHSEAEECKFLQIWVLPKQRNITPRYDQKVFVPHDQKNTFLTVVSGDKTSKEALWINQDAYFVLGELEAGKETSYSIQHSGNGVYIFVLDGEIEVADKKLTKRDGFGVWETNSVTVKSLTNASVLLIEVPMA